MTLILTAVCDRFIVQVADRRFVYESAGMATADDESTKQVVVNGDHFRLVAGFAGLAKAADERWSTGFWLAETIATEQAIGGGFKGCVDAARDAADRRFERIYRKDGTRAPLTLVFAGYTEGSPAPVMATVSNCRSGTFRRREAAEPFETTHSIMAGRQVSAEGLFAALPVDSLARIRAALKRGDAAAVTDVAVEQIRRATRHGKYGRGVGLNCMSISIVRDAGVEAIYHPTHGRAETWGPIFVEANDGAGIYILGPIQSKVLGSPPPGIGPMPINVGMSGTPVLDRRVLNRKRPPAHEPGSSQKQQRPGT